MVLAQGYAMARHRLALVFFFFFFKFHTLVNIVKVMSSWSVNLSHFSWKA